MADGAPDALEDALEEKRKIYRITELGSQVLALEMKRIERLYRNMMEVRNHEGA